MSTPRSALRTVGSLWFAAVLLVLLLVAMACATVVESLQSTERAQVDFYTAWWFEALLALLAVNILAATLARYPFTKRQIGFVLTHAGILVTFGGALVTQRWGINGQVGLAEGDSTDHLTVAGREVLTIVNRRDGTNITVDLNGSAFGGLDDVDQPKAPPLNLNGLSVEVQRYLPDGDWSKQVTDDSPRPRSAVQVSVSADGLAEPVWLFADHDTHVGGLTAVFQLAADDTELATLLSPPPADVPASTGTAQVTLQGSTFDVALEDCMGTAVPLGDTGYTVKVLRYLPHAIVGPDSQVTNASDRPQNPAIEAEFAGPAGTETKLAFARFPDFGSSMHGKQQIEGLKLVFIAPEPTASKTPLAVVAGPDGSLHVRFAAVGRHLVVRDLKPGTPVDSPWPGRKFAVLQRLDHARVDWLMEPVEPVRKERTQAILLELSTPEHRSQMWVPKYAPRPVTVEGTPYQATYSDKQLPLGFILTLNKPRVVLFPNSGRPSSYESYVNLIDPITGRSMDRVISMNNPVKYAGYTLYQSGLPTRDGKTISYLSVAWDPGLPIVFAGYIAMMLGMAVTLTTHLLDRRHGADGARSATAHPTDTGEEVPGALDQNATTEPRSMETEPGSRRVPDASGADRSAVRSPQ